jgi:hypothetical protein
MPGRKSEGKLQLLVYQSDWSLREPRSNLNTRPRQPAVPRTHAVGVRLSPNRCRTNSACPAMSSFANHRTWPLRIMQCLDTLNRSTRRLERSEALHRSHPSLDGSMVLLHDVVQASDGPAPATSAKLACSLQLCDDIRIRRVSVHVDHPRLRMAQRTQCFLKEPFGSIRVPSSAQEKIYGGACGIDRPI